MPRLYLINDDSMNAFATGRDRKHAIVAVTRGLLEKLDHKEVKAVVGHELTHIQNGDMRLMTAVTIIAGFILSCIIMQGNTCLSIGQNFRDTMDNGFSYLPFTLMF